MKTSYHLVMNDMVDSSHLREDGNWLLIWKLPIPPRIKFFLWKACKNCTPTRMNLQQKEVRCPSDCVVCEQGQESLFHLMLFCPVSIECWNLCNMWSTISHHALHALSFKDMFFRVMDSCDGEGRALFAMVLWSLWRGRNELLWEGNRIRSSSHIHRTTTFLSDWKQARNLVRVANEHAGSESQARWTDPPQGYYKCNVDAAFFNDLGKTIKTSFGMCIRDDNGQFIVARTDWVPFCLPTLREKPQGC